MEEILRGNQTLSGAYGTLWIDNIKCMEVAKVESKVTANRKEVQLGLSVDSKIIGLKGTGTLELNKVYSRAAEILKNWKKGKDVRSRLIIAVKDPDAKDGQEERISLDNVWFDELALTSFVKGEGIGETFSFGFTPNDAEYENEIK